MMKFCQTRFLMLMLLLLAACGATSDSNATSPIARPQSVTRQGHLIVRDAWSRPTGSGGANAHAEHGAAGTANGIVGVVYLTIENSGTVPDRLISATSSRAADISLHNSTIRDGMIEMIPMPDGLVISPTTTIELKPVGMHLMLDAVQTPLLANETYSLTLRFASNTEMTVPVWVKPYSE